MARTNLPIALDRFVGREAERDQLRDLLDTSRLVTIAGPGGIGKTRLIVEVGRDRVEQHPDGVWFIDLARIQDGGDVTRVAAEVFGINELPSLDQQDQLLDYLANKVCLLIVDNCEHIVTEAAQFIEEVLRQCIEVKVCATSREPLRVPGEVIFDAPALSLPSKKQTEEATTYEGSDAVRLFVERAQSADTRFELTPMNAATIASVCRRLDGVPLAIELAAARVRGRSLEDLSAGIDERFRLLAGGFRTAVPRHQTLLACVEWSYDLLTSQQQKVFRRLGAFVGPLSLSAALRVCGGPDLDDVDNVEEAFHAVVEQSLVQADHRRPTAPYRLLETIRHFAAMKLADSGEEDTVRDVHLDYYASLARHSSDEMQGPELPAAVERLSSEHENLTMALDWATRSHFEVALQMTAALATYWFTRGHWTEAKRRANTALAAEGAPPELRGAALAEVARIAAAAVDGPTAVALGETALQIGRALDDKKITAPALWALSTIYAFLDPKRARALAKESLEASRDAGLNHLRIRGETTLGIIEAQAGELEAARRTLLAAGDSARTEGVSLALVPNLAWLTWTCANQGTLDEAERYANEGLDLCRQLGNPQFESYLTSMLVMILAYKGERDRAHVLFDAALVTAEKLNDPAGMTAALGAKGVLASYSGDLVSAADACNDVIPLARVAGPPWMHAFALLGLSEVMRWGGDAKAAVAAAVDGGEVARTAANRWLEARSKIVEASAMLADDEPDMAETLVHDAVPILLELGARLDLVTALHVLSGVAVAASSWLEAERRGAAAALLADEIGYVWPVHALREIVERDAAINDGLGESAVQQIRDEVRTVGWEEVIELASRGRGRRARLRSGWDSLTRTELKVVALVADGLTNPAIGERMFISPRTVQAHLSHVFAKLDVSSRSELAAEAARRALQI